MKNWQIIVFAALTISAVIYLSQKESATTDAAYESWKADFGKKFGSQEDSYRQMIFSKMIQQIESHNSDKTHTYTKGLNQFSHLSKEEFAGLFLNRFYQMTSTINQVEDQTMSQILEEIDWQALGKVSAVRDQGNCDSGYAFCSASLAESFYLFKNQNVTLSEQQIIDCSADYTTFGCQSGSRNGTLIYIREKGLNTESSYPYKAVKNTCQKSTGDYKPVYTHKQFSGCDDIKAGLYSSPLTVAVNALQWQTYKSGVFDGCTSTAVNHDTYLIGVSAESWRVKNSWGVRWGEYGFIRLKLGNTCGICEKPAFGFQ